MNNYVLIRTLLILLLKLTLTLSEHTDCDCVTIEECKYVENILKKTMSDAYITYCDKRTQTVCCPRQPKQTIAEKKCMEFAEIDGFCPRDGLIRDGVITRPHEMPFMVSVQLKKPGESPSWTCGGALIDPKFVITAGHCFDDLHNNPNITVSVLLGAHNRTGSGTRFMATVIKHPDYGPDPLADIALLKLDNEANISTEKIRPICLTPTNGSEIKEFMAAGWGQYNGSAQPRELLKTTLLQKEFENCPMENDDKPDINKQICGTPKNTMGDVCHGDSGGPIFVGYPGRDDCLFSLIAVVSQGKSCDVAGSFTLHTRISYYRKWIESIVWPEETST